MIISKNNASIETMKEPGIQWSCTMSQPKSETYTPSAQNKMYHFSADWMCFTSGKEE